MAALQPELTWALSRQAMSCHFLNSSWLYWHPGLSLVLDLVDSQPVPTHIRSPFSATAAPESRFRLAKLRRTRPFFSSAIKAISDFGSSRLDLPGLIRSRRIGLSFNLSRKRYLQLHPRSIRHGPRTSIKQ